MIPEQKTYIMVLAEVLSVQVKYFKELITCLERETHELAEINLEAMAELNRQKEDVAARIESHAESVRKAIRETALQEGLEPDATLGKLAVRLKTKGNLEISRLHGELNTLADRNRQLLTINRDIAERFSSSIGNTLELLTRLVNQSSIYGSSGGYQRRPTGSVMINREA